MNQPRFWLVPLLVAGGVGCTGIEGGNPVAPTIDGSKIMLLAIDDNTVQAVGEPGAVDPETASVRYLELEGTGNFENELVNADGSFDFEISADSLNTFRFRAIDGEQRSNPVDRKASAPGGPLPGSQTCLQYEPDLTFESAGQIRSTTVLNGCGRAVTFEPPRLRFAQDDYLFDEPETLNLEPDAELELTVTRNMEGASENVLLLENDEQTIAVSLLAR